MTDSWDDTVDLVLKIQNLWVGIHTRCNAPNGRSYKDYGAKGIELCAEWSHRKGQIRFIKWALKNGYKPELDLDRKDNTKGYSPDNCRFITHQANCWNKSNNTRLTYDGETKCSAEWSHDPRCVVPSYQFQQRVSRGWDIQRALTTPLRKR